MAAIRQVDDILNIQNVLSEISCSRTDAKIYNVATHSFKTLKELFYFPSRYIGAKDFSVPGIVFKLILSLFSKDEPLFSSSGYHRYQEKKLTSHECLQFVKYAAPVAALHTLNESWTVPTNFKLYEIREGEFPTFKTNGKCFFDETTGLKASISFNETEVIVAFGALGCFAHLYQDLPEAEKIEKTDRVKRIQKQAAIHNILGLTPSHYGQADALFQLIKNHPSFEGKKITVVGHCWGGSIAEFIGIKNQVPAVCFNSLAMGAGVQEILGDTLLAQANKYVTHLSVAGDYTSDNDYIAIFDRAISLLGIRTPGNFGRRFVIPAAPDYRKPVEIHSYVIGSLVVHLGYSLKNKFDVLSPLQIAIVKDADAANFQVEL